jgi:hypothetical protein
MGRVSSVQRGICRGIVAQNFGLKSQDRAGPVVFQSSNQNEEKLFVSA